MSALLEILLAPPTVFFTVPVGLVMLYWVSVLVGAVDIELFEGAIDGAADGIDGAMEGAVEGAMDAALDGAVEGAVEGAVDGAMEGAAEALDAVEGVDVDVDADVGGLGAIRWLAFIFRLGKVPVTITATLILLCGWTISFLFAWQLGGRFDVPPAAFSAGVLGVSTVAGVAFANVMSRPLEPVFTMAVARDRQSLVGEICEVSTGRVDERFGQAMAMLDGDDLLFPIRCDGDDNGLKRGSEALIVSYDKTREAFVVEPLSRPTTNKSTQKTASRAAQTERSTEELT